MKTHFWKATIAKPNGNETLEFHAPTAGDAVYIAVVKTVGTGGTPDTARVVDLEYLGERELNS